ncbi:hypothetical protein B0T17DRAFT_575280 [Bombardia bombarda]|uniref:DNA mismatch repair protein PMS1 n=1 Tax=Bombardia bombarda TaxID=252184 RepID=A0AA39X988_9PEZI|nr:hypothetical protein B0T17DRAFT_575280 [Bombardia bombarda]
MASDGVIKAIDHSTVHQIQSGQVIVDLCSVAKELVENGIDAGATAIDVRFKNQGLDAIEVQDNGSGISSQNYESIALKHYTSKLYTYDDLSTLQTFGFRGEALSSLCALSIFTIVTCTQQEAPRATKLGFEMSGKLKGTSVVSGQKGTTVVVENLFHNLPVRRRELERNIKREWGKVIGLLNQYACVQTGVKFTVSQQPTKGKRMVLFSTKGNPTTRDNIINVFGVKTMNALITLDLTLEMKPTNGLVKKGQTQEDDSTAKVHIRGHVSRPTHGEGRQTPDRQMFYVNGRPCGLPQFAKVFNEVYRSYNASQSPFIFADIQLDTHMYDVNVSPDKRTILLHDQGQMLDNMRESLIELFETQDVTIPVAQSQSQRYTPFKKPVAARGDSIKEDAPESPHSVEAAGSKRPGQLGGEEDGEGESTSDADEPSGKEGKAEQQTLPTRLNKKPGPSRLTSATPQSGPLLARWLERKSDVREQSDPTVGNDTEQRLVPQPPEEHDREQGGSADKESPPSADSENSRSSHQIPLIAKFHAINTETNIETHDSGDEMDIETDEQPVLAIPPPSQPPAPKSHPVPSSRPSKRPTQEMATITIGDDSVTALIGSSAKRVKTTEASDMTKPASSSRSKQTKLLPSFGGRLTQMFSASASAQDGLSGDLLVTKEYGLVEEDEEDEDENENQDEDGDEDEESLFVSQHGSAEGGEIDDDEGHGDEKEESEIFSDDDKPTSGQNAQDSAMAIGDADSPMASDEHTSPDHGHCEHAHDDVENGDEDEYIDDDDEKKAREDKKVKELIKAAEVKAAVPADDSEKRSQMLLKGRSKRKDDTLSLVHNLKVDETTIGTRIHAWTKRVPPPPSSSSKTAASQATTAGGDNIEAEDAEAKLALKISKSDFAKMRIVGQFNLGFVLAVREAAATPEADSGSSSKATDDELFIIDQHASDEKYNFERLQASTIVQSQRLVQPKTLELTALEEEIIIEHGAALERNGFIVRVDTSGAGPVGARCQLLSLPLSRETTFSLADLEELIFLLADNPSSSATTIPRPSKVRKMFAMRACRSSIMIGKALSGKQMERVVRHMGEMEKPWNCPHGRPTMRHLCGLGAAWGERAWVEGMGLERGMTDWAEWIREKRED